MFIDFVQSLLSSPRLREGVAWTRRGFNPADTLIAEGSRGESLFIVEEGRLAVLGWAQVQSQPGMEILLSELTIGDVFGESSLIDECPSLATVRALTPGSVLEINGAMLTVYLDDHPQQGYLFFKQLLAAELSNLARANRGVLELSTIGVRLRGLRGCP